MQTTAFARATRLTAEEVADLCLDPLRDRYPPLELDYVTDSNWARRSTELPFARGWVLTSSSLYCPDCLAGNGSLIEQAHGGPWRRQWRLVVVFTCALHRRLLHHRCPHCDLLALDRESTRTVGLIPAHTLIQHPTRCRRTEDENRHTSTCGQPLDQAPRINIDPGELDQLLTVQTRLLGALRLDDSQPITNPHQVSKYFYDLDLHMRLIRATWPAAAPTAPPQINLNAIAEHVEQQQREMAHAREHGKRVIWNLPLREGPPQDARARGHLLAFADHLTTEADANDIRTSLIAALTDKLPNVWQSFLQQYPGVEEHRNENRR